jgi:hypothetical protein
MAEFRIIDIGGNSVNTVGDNGVSLLKPVTSKTEKRKTEVK